MLQQTRFIQEAANLTDRFDNPFVDDLFVRAGAGRLTAPVHGIVQSGGYQLPFDLQRNSRTLGFLTAGFLAHGNCPIGGAFLNKSGYYERNEDDFHSVLDLLAETSGANLLLWPYFPLKAREFGWLKNWLVKRLGLSPENAILSTRFHQRAFLNCESPQCL